MNHRKNLKKKIFLRAIIRSPYKVIVILKYFINLIAQKSIGMKNIEEIRDKHKGEAVFIIGSGPSLDTYPDDFVDNKISITLHMAYMKFPNTTYTHITEADRIQWFKKFHLAFFNSQGLYCNPLFPLVSPNSILKNIKMKSPPYLLKYSPKRLKFKNVEDEVESAYTGKKFRYHSNSTCLHTGIWCAIILGFKTINIIGCDFSDNKGKHYCSTANVSDTRARSPEFFEDAYQKMNNYTNEIVEISKKYGIKINRFLNYEDYMRKK